MDAVCMGEPSRVTSSFRPEIPASIQATGMEITEKNPALHQIESA